jgi:hypothetical protein
VILCNDGILNDLESGSDIGGLLKLDEQYLILADSLKEKNKLEDLILLDNLLVPV